MTHLSRNRLDKETEKELINKLSLALNHVKNAADMSSLLTNLLTDTERLMIAKRLAIITLLDEGLPDAHIAEVLHVTRITVAKMRYYNEARGNGFSLALSRLKSVKPFEEFKQMLLSLATYSARAAGG